MLFPQSNADAALDLNQARRKLRQGLFLAALAVAAVYLAYVSGRIHDYKWYVREWRIVLRGADPWRGGTRAVENTYGPLFNLFAPLYDLNWVVPKLFFVGAWLFLSARILNKMRESRAKLLAFAILFSPFFWIEVAYFGHFDVVVAALCVWAVDDIVRGRDSRAGLLLALGTLLKLVPLFVFPFLVFSRQRVRLRFAATFIATIGLGFALSFLYWGPSTFDPLSFAASRKASLLSIWAYLSGSYSPLHGLPIAHQIASYSSAVMILSLAALWVAHLRLKLDLALVSVSALLVVFLLYRVGHPQFHVIIFALLAYRMSQASSLDRFELWAGAAYVAWFNAFSILYVVTDGLKGSYHSIREWVGLPSFLVILALLVSQLRVASKTRLLREGI